MRRLEDVKQAFSHTQESQDDDTARRLYVLAEMARGRDDDEQHDKLLDDLRAQFPQSKWLEEALLSSYNMHLLRKEYDKAIQCAKDMYQLFPKSRYAPYLHWKAAWLTLRAGNNAGQIELYPASAETPNALYWRGRLLEEENDPGRAKAYYSRLESTFLHYYYADLARERLENLREVSVLRVPLLDRVSTVEKPAIEDIPADDFHIARARLLANAGLVDFATAEILAQSNKASWAPLAVADLYDSIGMNYRALQVLKRAFPGYYTFDLKDLPRQYWSILFPQPYWEEIQRYATRNGLDAFLVASLIRQESEFNPGAVSHADAYGLMQLLPKVGKNVAKELKIRRFSTPQLLDPDINIQLGTRYFRQLTDQFGGSVEYALASYNAGSDRVQDWRNQGKFRDVYEWVESIPFTETREYVQAILRNASIYRQLYTKTDVSKKEVASKEVLSNQ